MAVVINVYGKADLKQIQRAEAQLAGMKREVASQPGVWSRMGSAVSSTGAKIAAGLAAAGVAVFLKNAVTAASDLQESTSKNAVVFKAQAGAMQAWASTAAGAMGMSQQAALEASGTFGNLLTAMDITGPKAVNMSQGMVQLASDLASFNNIDPAVALEKLRAGLVGEVEPLRTLGVNLSAVAVEAEAFRLGLVKGKVDAVALQSAQSTLATAQAKYTEVMKDGNATSVEKQAAAAAVARGEAAVKKALAGTKVELTAAQKAQASYSLIMQQTKTAQGDFARTSGGLANQQRILKARFTDFSAKVGQVVLPVVTELTSRAVSLLGAFMKLPGPVQKIAMGLAAVGVAALILAPFVSSAIAVAKGLKLAAAAAKVYAAAQWLLNAAMSANPIALIVIAIVALVAVFVVLWKKCGWFRAFWIGLWGKVKSVFAGVLPALKAIGSKVVAVLGWVWDRVSGAVKAFWGWAGPFIRTAVTLWWTQIKLTVTAIVVVVRAAWNTISAAVKWFWGWAGPFITRYVQGWWTVIKATMAAISAGVRAAWGAIQAIVAAAIRVITANVRAISAVVAIVRSAWDAVRSVTSAAWGAVAGAVSGAWSRISGAVSAGISRVVSTVRTLGGKIKGAIGNVGRLLYSVGEDIVRGLLKGITDAWHWITDKLKSLIGSLSSAAKKLLGINSPSRVFAGIGASIGEGLALGISASSSAAAAAAAGMIGGVTGAGTGSPAFAGSTGSGGRSVTIASGAVVVNVNGGNGSPAEIGAATAAAVSPALVELAREIRRL